MKWIKIVTVSGALLCVYLFCRATDFRKVLLSLQQVGPGFLTTLFTTFLAYMAATVGWKFCLGRSGRNLPLGNLFLIRHVGETAGMVNPTGIVGGEAVKVFLLGDKGINRQTVVLSVIVSRILMIVSQLLMFFVAVSFLLSTSFTVEPGVLKGIAVLSATTICAVVVCWLTLRQMRNSRFSWLKKIRIRKAGAAIAARFYSWKTAYTSYVKGNRKAVLWSFLFFMLHWLLGATEFYFILLFLGIKTTIIKALFIDMGVIFFKAAGAFVPGQIGIEEYGNKVMLAMIGVTDAEIWVSASVLRRARQLFWIAAGISAYIMLSPKLKTLKKRKRQHADLGETGKDNERFVIPMHEVQA